LLGREGRAGRQWAARASSLSYSSACGPPGSTTPWPPPQRGGESLGGLPSLVKEGLGVVAQHPNPMNREPGFTPNRKARKGRKERQSSPSGASSCLSVLARAVLVFPGRSTNCDKYKNRGNELKEYLKTKHLAPLDAANELYFECKLTRIGGNKIRRDACATQFSSILACRRPMGTDFPKGIRFAPYPSEGFEKDAKIVGTNSINFFRIS